MKTCRNGHAFAGKVCGECATKSGVKGAKAARAKGHYRFRERRKPVRCKGCGESFATQRVADHHRPGEECLDPGSVGLELDGGDNRWRFTLAAAWELARGSDEAHESATETLTNHEGASGPAGAERMHEGHDEEVAV